MISQHGQSSSSLLGAMNSLINIFDSHIKSSWRLCAISVTYSKRASLFINVLVEFAARRYFGTQTAVRPQKVTSKAIVRFLELVLYGQANQYAPSWNGIWASHYAAAIWAHAMTRRLGNYGECFEEIRILWKCFGNAYGYAFDTNAMNDLFDVLSASLEA